MYKIEKNIFLQLDIHTVNWFSKKGLELQTVKNKKFAFLKEMILRLFLRRHVSQCTDYRGGSICFFKDRNLRWDHIKAYENAYKSAGEFCWKIEYETINDLDIIRTLCLLKFIIVDLRKTVKMKKGPLYWSLICSYIIVMDFINDIEKYDFGTANLGVVYCDAAPVDHIFVYYLKSKGIKTATLQHGVSSAPQNIDKTYRDPGGIIFMNSNSDYYLAMNPFSKDEAVKSGVSTDKIKVMGILRYAYCDYKVNKKNETGIFGVILPGEGPAIYEYVAEKLVEYANFLAKRLNMKFYLKYHPGHTEFKYDGLADRKYFAGHLPIKTNILEYSEAVDFTLVSGSTVFMELVYLGQRVYRMCIDEEKFDPYRNIEINSFKDQERLLELATSNDSRENELFYYLCYTKKPERNYEAFFQKFV